MHFSLTCTDCNVMYNSAGSLLQHFAQHVTNMASEPNNTKKLNVPDLYPISLFKNVIKSKKNSPNSFDSEDNVDSGIEDAHPMFLCTVSIDESEEVYHEKYKSKRAGKKYKCASCLRSFGWSTDLKRHMLTHTGERPFKCLICDDSFTRKFLLQKHQLKQHQLKNQN